YQTAAGDFFALKGLDLRLKKGEFVGMVGKSGAGKSTLINMLAGIDRPTAGEIFVGGRALHHMSESDIAAWRGQNVGVIFQFFQLMPSLTCLQNVMLPMDFANLYGSEAERRTRALALLEQMDIAEHAFKPPSAVSGGQQQRVAIARALACDPAILLADEPTGNLDSKTATAVFDIFHQLIDQGKTIFMVSHDRDLAHQVHRTLTLADGRLVASPPREKTGS
ncbi:MAG: ABC transporter ATP-binding protein, partial [Anaerolineales bacterium]|nr:ABC transporter ATP-binding protein [Anaerolineales bacterium]